MISRHRFRVVSLALTTGALGVLNIVFGVATARAMGPSGRGELALVITIASTAAIVGSLGINVAARHYLPRSNGDVTLGHYHSMSLVLTALCAMACGLIGFAFFGSKAGGIVWLTAAAGAGACATYLEIDALNATGNIQSAVVIGCIGAAMQLLVFACGSWIAGPTTNVALTSVILGYSVQVPIALLVLNRSGHSVAPKTSRASWRRLGKMGIPALGVNAGQSMIFRFDRYVIAAVMNPAALGVYSVAVTGSEITRIIPQAWGQYAQYRTASNQLSSDNLKTSRKMVLICSLPMIALVAWFAPEIVTFTVGRKYLGAVTPWRWLSVGEIGVIAYQIDSRLLSAVGKTVAAGAIGATGLIVVVALDLLLVPIHGLTGAGLASAAAYLLIGALGAISFHRNFEANVALDPPRPVAEDSDLL